MENGCCYAGSTSCNFSDSWVHLKLIQCMRGLGKGGRCRYVGLEEDEKKTKQLVVFYQIDKRGCKANIIRLQKVG